MTAGGETGRSIYLKSNIANVAIVYARVLENRTLA
jgi:hypothetical protein